LIPATALSDEVTVYVTTEDDETGAFGDPIEEEDDGTAIRAFVDPLDATEEELNAETRITRYRITMEADVEIDGTARVEWRGISMEILGEPKRFADIVGPHHIELEAREIKG
jgi:hypothetical protein